MFAALSPDVPWASISLSFREAEIHFVFVHGGGGVSSSPLSLESSKEPESRKKDVIVNTLEPTETKSERIKRKEASRRGAVSGSEVWIRSAEKMERVDFRFPSGCCQVYK